MNGQMPYTEPYLQALQDSRKAYSHLGISVIVLFVAYLGSAYTLSYIAAYVMPSLYQTWWFSWLINMLPLYAIAFPAFLWCIKRAPVGAHDPTYDAYGYVYQKPKFHIGHFCLFFLMAVGLMYIGSFIGNAMMSWMSQKTGASYENGLNDLAANSQPWMIFFGSVVIAPLGEELMFRKLFIDRARRYGDGMAIVLSALLFALFHGNFFQFFYAFFVGAVMAYLYTLTGKFIYPAFMHMGLNFVGMMLMPNLLDWLGLSELATLDPENTAAIHAFIQAHSSAYAVYSMITLMIYAIMIFAVVMLLYLIFKRKIYLGQGEVILRSEDRALAAFGNKGISICIFLLCFVMALNFIPMPQ